MSNKLTRSAIRIYGALSALGNDSGDLLQGLSPFFEPILKKYNGQKLDPNRIAVEVRDLYKWNFNSDLVETFVPSFVNQGWISADLPNGNDTTYTIKVGDEAVSDDSIKTIESELREIAKQFQGFARSLSPLTSIPYEIEEYENILIEYLLYIEAYSEYSVDFKTKYRPNELGKISHTIEIPNITSLRDDEKFLCARFVKYSIQEGTKNAEILSKIASIGLLTEVVQDFVRPTTAIESTDLVIYLDAPVAMELLNVSGKIAFECTEPVICELIRIGAKIRIFEQSIDEMKNSLEAVLNSDRPNGPTAEALVKKEVLREYVVGVSRNPAHFLEKYGISVVYRNLEQFPNEHQYFSKEDCDSLYSALAYSENPTARGHDADITTLVSRQRHGKSSNDIFKSTAVVITRNGLFAQVVRKTCMKLGRLPKNAVPPVIHRRQLVTAVWLRTGLGAGNLNVPKRLLLASCEAVLAIRPGVVDAVRRFTESIGDEEKVRQLDLLISQERSAQALMDKTLGLTNVVTQDNFPILWQEMLQPHLQEVKQKSEDEVKKVENEAKQKLDAKEKQIREIEKEKQKTVGLVTHELNKKLEEDKALIDSLCSKVSFNLWINKNIKRFFAILIAIFATYTSIMNKNVFWQIISIIFALIFGYLSVIGGKVFQLNVNEAEANKALEKAAKKAGLTAKLKSFKIDWTGEKLLAREK